MYGPTIQAPIDAQSHTAAPATPPVNRKKASDADPNAVAPSTASSVPVLTASTGLRMAAIISTREAGPEGSSDATANAGRVGGSDSGGYVDVPLLMLPILNVSLYFCSGM